MKSYQLKLPIESTFEVKKSQFIVQLLPVDNRHQALQQLQKVKSTYPDARHHCWAYRIGSSEQSMTAAMSDDGEPSGTAGKPILNVLQHKSLINIMAVVTRYFGGIKLGAGGLVRAYSQSIEQACGKAEFELLIPQVEIKVALPFSQEQWLRYQTEQLQGHIIKVEYNQEVLVILSLPASHLDVMSAQLKSHSLDFSLP